MIEYTNLSQLLVYRSRSRWLCVRSVGLRSLDLWDYGFESSWGSGCSSLVFVVCRQRLLQRADHKSRGSDRVCVCVCVCVCMMCMYIRKWVNNYPHYRYKLYFNKNRKLIFQHSLLAFQCTSSIFAQASLCPQKRMFLAEQRATHAPLPSCVTLVRPFLNFFIHS